MCVSMDSEVTEELAYPSSLNYRSPGVWNGAPTKKVWMSLTDPITGSSHGRRYPLIYYPEVLNCNHLVDQRNSLAHEYEHGFKPAVD
jgi:hypothetical protein